MWLRHMVTPNTVTPLSYATWLRQIRLRHMVTPVMPNTVTPHSYATCGYATVTPHGYATYGTPSLASLRHPASLLASLHDVTT